MLISSLPSTCPVATASTTLAYARGPTVAPLGLRILYSSGVTFADSEVNRTEIDRFRQVEIVTIDANHWPLTEAPKETRRAIEGWVERTFPPDMSSRPERA